MSERLFIDQMEHRARKTRHALGVKIAAIYADAAQKGALSGDRMQFPLVDALEEHWQALVDGVADDIRSFGRSRRRRRKLISAAADRLNQLRPHLIEASRLERPKGAFEARLLGKDSKARVEALSAYQDMRLQQAAAGIGEERGGPPGRVTSFVGKEVAGWAKAGILTLLAAAVWAWLS